MNVVRKCRRVTFSKQPLALVLAQLRFSPIARMSEYVAAIQDELRKLGFPNYSEKEAFGLEISPEGVKQNQFKQWFFESADQETSFLVDTGQVVFQTASYRGFENFMELFLDLTDVVLRVTDLNRVGLIQRLGLRFINRIVGEDWREYLRSTFHGAGSNLFTPESQLFAQTTMGKVTLPNNEPSTFLLRLHQSKSPGFLPPDLLAFAPKRSVEGNSVPGIGTLIDMDHFWEGTLGPEIGEDVVATLFFALHDTIIEFFHQTVISDEAIRRWS